MGTVALPFHSRVLLLDAQFLSAGFSVEEWNSFGLHWAMKDWLLLFVALVCLPAQAAQIGFWAQNEASGNLIDSTGNHPSGIPTGSPTYGQPGVPNGSYGSISIVNAAGASIAYGPSSLDQYFTIGADNNNPVMNLDTTGAFTLMGWINPNAPTAASTYRFLSTGSAAGADRGWGIGLRLANVAGTGSSIRFTSYGILDNDSSLFDVTFGSWIHVAVTYNNGTINYFLNGTALDSDTSSFGNETVNGRLVIGGRVGGNDVDQANGRLDGIQVYDSVLSAAQIQSAAAASVSAVPEPSTLVLCALAALCFLCVKRRVKNTSI
jgi:hypothetical protein